jgi:hypothetical protein
MEAGMAPKVKRQKLIERQFLSLFTGHLEAFLAACSDELVVTAHGGGTTYVTFGKEDVGEWFESFSSLSAASLPVIIHADVTGPHTATVLVRGSFAQVDDIRILEIANFLVYQDEQLIKWSSYPTDVTVSRPAMVNVLASLEGSGV